MKRILLPFLILKCCLTLHAQQSFVNNGNLSIFTGASITSFGDFTNKSSASFSNNGNFYIKGNLNNDQSSLAIGSGTLHLDGTNAQTINGLQKFRTYNLQTNNSAGVILNSDLSVSGLHTFSSGIITSSAMPNYLVYEAGSSYTGASDARHVRGWVKKIGNSNFIFPTGNGSFLREIEIQNLSANSEFNARYNAVTQNIYNLQSPIINVNPTEYWTLNRVSGGTAQVKLNWDNSKTPFPGYVISDLRVGHYSGTAWIGIGGSASGNVTTSGTITSNITSDFGSFALASTSFPVPLKFLGIAAQRQNSAAKITWQTANEVDVDFYEIQRSTDGNIFTRVAITPAKNLDFQSYSILDLDVPSSKLFYRIKANDADGSTRYSTIAILSAIQQNGKIELLTNPVQSFILLATHNVTPSLFSYEVINSAGQLCKKGSLKMERSSTISIPVTLLPGSYTLIISNSIERHQFKLIAQ